MMHLLAFRTIAAHISFDVAKLFVFRMLESQGNLYSFLAQYSSMSLQMTSYPGPMRTIGGATATAAFRLAAILQEVEVVAPPPPPPPSPPPWAGGVGLWVDLGGGGAKMGP
jgi:hypothetical protein